MVVQRLENTDQDEKQEQGEERANRKPHLSSGP